MKTFGERVASLSLALCAVALLTAGSVKADPLCSFYPFLFEWGSSGSGSGQFQNPTAVAFTPAGDVLVGDSGRIQRFNGFGSFRSQWTVDLNGNAPGGVAVDQSGRVFVAIDLHVEVFDATGAPLLSWPVAYAGNPAGIAVDAMGNVFVSDTGDLIWKFDGMGNLLTTWGSPGDGPGQFSIPRGLAVDANGDVLVVDSGNHRVEKFDSGGTFLASWSTLVPDDPPNGFCPAGIAIGTDGAIFVTITCGLDIEFVDAEVFKYDPDGTFVARFGFYGSNPGQSIDPLSVAVNGRGEVVEAGATTDRIEKFGCGKSICGNGLLDPGEDCDDGNTANGDGCSASCTLEDGWNCSGQPSVCTRSCGDGFTDPGEDCDDGPANGTPGSCCMGTCHFQSAGTPCTGAGSCAGNSDTCTFPTCFGGTLDGWAFSAEVSAQEGLVLNALRYGPRRIARHMGVTQVALATASDVGAGQLSPSPDPLEGSFQSKLVNYTCVAESFSGKATDAQWPADSVGAEATYQVTLPQTNTSVLVKQSYRFDTFKSFERCEPTELAPCVRFWPSLTWVYPGADPPDGLRFESIQRFELDPDAEEHGAATLVSDHKAHVLTHLAFDSVDNGHFKSEGMADAIDKGQEVYWDNWHQTDRTSVGLPGINLASPKPGCAECVHAHWVWNSAVNQATPGWTDGKPEILDGSKQSDVVLWVKYDPADDPLANPYALIDSGAAGKISSKSDRVVMYWDASTDVSDCVTDGVFTCPSVGLHDAEPYDGDYLVGDSYWPQLVGHAHGGNGSMFLVPARLLMSPTTTTTSEPWQVVPLWGEIVNQPTALDPRLPAGYVLPVIVQYVPPSGSPKIKGGPFYLRVNGNCISDSLLNPDATYAETPLGPPWLKLYRDSFTPASGHRQASFKPGATIDTVAPGTSFTSYLVFATPPEEGSLTFEIVAAPYGTSGYYPAVDTDPNVNIGSLVCSSGP